MIEKINTRPLSREEVEAWLRELLGERVDYRLTTERSSGKTLAEYYSFCLDALAAGKDPDEYYRVGEAHPTMVEVHFGKHLDDIRSKCFHYDSGGQLKEAAEVVLWRKNGFPDFVRPAKLAE
ncbi:MAG: hypothetical protein AAB548_00705 [Patescibacteria group bacterium]